MDPLALIFFGLGAFVILRLLSVLGTKTGHEKRPDLEGVQRPLKPARGEGAPSAATDRKLAPVSPQATPLRDADPGFDEKLFLDGARAAYEMIVEAFAAGDLKSIRRFLAQSVYDAFKAAVSEREERGFAYELKFVGIDNAAIVSSQADDEDMTVVADFSSNQVRVTRDREGKVIEGDANRIDLIKDRWTFSRKTKSADPNWLLVATGAA